MTSFGQIESSRSKGTPVTLFLFKYGPAATDIYAYTDAERPMEWNGVTYRPVPIKRQSVKSSGTLDKSTLEIRAPHDSEVGELFRVYPPPQPVTLIVFQGHYSINDKQFLACWSGRIVACGREGNEVKLAGELVNTSMRRPGLRRNYQLTCPLVLYGSSCRAVKAAATRKAVVMSISGPNVTLAANWAPSNLTPKFIGGLMEWTAANGAQEVRTILRVTNGNVLMLGGLSPTLFQGIQVSVVFGCDHTMDDCRGLHSNILNYGGQPWIPTTNPIGYSSIFY